MICKFILRFRDSPSKTHPTCSLRPGIQPKLESLRKLYAGKKIIIGRDKLDVVKGIVQKLRAFEKLLHDYPEWRGKVVLIQVRFFFVTIRHF